ncbi:acyl-CoA carboxylase epsilon subunit [Streptomyces sp. NBC_00091]|uniref:acyl-CoA carboxylase epsilon subunit n=1 Tax=Streptomyces sp. NBC_00091 TaxID=2975648 RepID=UPI00224ED905|nr:acyl-CoA carboxylase epsilon subunit [Streptomyces sp. NBC_00091]MCX5381049.1 acyl-CoA carboxylase epsilon subunit [Streptomyces sp. NBC_00091]
MSPAEAQLQQAAFHVIGGSPTLEEVAAIAALLTARMLGAEIAPPDPLLARAHWPVGDGDFRAPGAWGS